MADLRSARFVNCEKPEYLSLLMLGKKSFPDDLVAWLCSRSHIEAFTKEAKEIGVEVLGESEKIFPYTVIGTWARNSS